MALMAFKILMILNGNKMQINIEIVKYVTQILHYFNYKQESVGFLKLKYLYTVYVKYK